VSSNKGGERNVERKGVERCKEAIVGDCGGIAEGSYWWWRWSVDQEPGINIKGRGGGLLGGGRE